MAYKLKNGKIYQAEVVNLLPAMRAFTDSFIVSNPGPNYTVSELHHRITYSVIVTASKRYFCIIVPQLDGEVFPTFVAIRQRR